MGLLNYILFYWILLMKKFRINYVDQHRNRQVQEVECSSIIDVGGVTYFLDCYQTYTPGSALQADRIVYAIKTELIVQIFCPEKSKSKNSVLDDDYRD